MKVGDVIFWVAVLIGMYLVATNWKGVNALLGTSAGASVSLVRTLQGR